MARKHQRHSHTEAGGNTKVAPTPIQHSGIMEPAHDDIARLAYALWEARGRPIGSPEEDWFRAEEELRSGVDITHSGTAA